MLMCGQLSLFCRLNVSQYNNKNSVISVCFASCIFVVMCLFSTVALAYTGVTIVMSSKTEANLAFVEQFKAELTSDENNTLSLKVLELPARKRLVVAENSELVIALGEKALEAASKLSHTTPVLAVYTPTLAYEQILEKSRRDASNMSMIMQNQPYARQIHFIQLVLPAAKNIGSLVNGNSQAYGEQLKMRAEKKGLNLQLKHLNDSTRLLPELKTLLETNDALLAIPDTAIYKPDTAQPILMTSYQFKKPVLSYSLSYVKAGALAALFSSSRQLAKQAAEIAQQSQIAGNPLPLPQVPKYFSVRVNRQVARLLNIEINSDMAIYQALLAADPLQNE